MGKKPDDAIPFVLRGEWEDELEMLDMAERGELFTMLFQYSRTREVPETENRVLAIVFQRWKKWLDQDYEKLMDKRERRQKAGRAGGLAKASNARNNPSNASNANQSVAMLDFARKNVANLASNQLPVTSYQLPVTERDNTERYTEEDKEKTHKKEMSVVSVSDSVPQDEFAAIVSYYSAHIEIDMPPAVASQILAFLHDMDSAVIIEAMEEAVRRNAPRWPYIKSILNTWRGAGVKTIDDLDNYQTTGGRRNGRNHEADKPTVSKYDLPQLPGITVV